MQDTTSGQEEFLPRCPARMHFHQLITLGYTSWVGSSVACSHRAALFRKALLYEHNTHTHTHHCQQICKKPTSP